MCEMARIAGRMRTCLEGRCGIDLAPNTSKASFGWARARLEYGDFKAVCSCVPFGQSKSLGAAKQNSPHAALDMPVTPVPIIAM